MFQNYVAYFKDNPQGYWFKAKLYGWGWTPVKWQGWIVIALYVGVLFLLSRGITPEQSFQELLVPFFIPFLAATALLIAVCYIKGEKPRWQWGPPEQKNDN